VSKPRRHFPVWLAAGLIATACAAKTDHLLETLRKANSGLHRFVLENGLVCIVKQEPAASRSSVQLWIRSGSLDESGRPGSGLARLVQTMLAEATVPARNGTMRARVREHGGTFRADTDLDHTVFAAEMPNEQWAQGLRVLAETVLYAALPGESNLPPKLLRRVLGEIEAREQDPDRVLRRLLRETAYRVHPHRIPVAGYREVFLSLRPNDLTAFRRSTYVPNNMIAIVVGAADAHEVERALRALFAAVPRRPRLAPVLPPEPVQPAARTTRKVGYYKLGRLGCVWHTVAMNHPDAPALDLLAEIVGTGNSSRLAQALMEERRLVHKLRAWSWTPKEPGLFGIATTFEPDKEDAVRAALAEQVDAWSEQLFNANELEKARRLILTRTFSRLATPRGQAESYALGELHAGEPRFAERYLEELQQVEPADVRRVVRDYLRDQNRTLLVLSPEYARVPPGIPAATLLPSDMRKDRLPNGLTLLTREDRRLPLVHICAGFRGGPDAEPTGFAGITKLMSALLARGTATRSAQQLAESIETMGAELDAFCGPDTFGLRASCFSPDVRTVLDMLADCLLNPSFETYEIKRQQLLQAGALNQRRERPECLAEQKLRHMLWPKHPYAQDRLGTDTSIHAVTQNALRQHYRRLVVGPNAVLALVGDISPTEAAHFAKRLLRGMPAGTPTADEPTIQRAGPDGRLPANETLRIPGARTLVLAAYPGCPAGDPRRDALDVLCEVMNGPRVGLAVQARERLDAVYDVRAAHAVSRSNGLLLLRARVGTLEELPELTKLFDQETARLASGGMSIETFDRARLQLIARAQERNQDGAALARTCAVHELTGLGYAHAFSTVQRLNALNREDVRRAAASVFVPSRRAIVVVSP